MRKSSWRSHSHTLTRSCLVLALVSGSCSVLVPLPTLARDAQKDRVIRLNNDGVRLLRDDDFEGAAEKFNEALRLNPGYSLARDNLAIAYNNRAIQSSDNREAMKYFHLSKLLAKQNKTTENNLAVVRGKLYKDTKSFDGIVKIARDCQKNGDQAGAMLEYQRALELKNDASVAAELGKVHLPDDLKRILGAPRDSSTEAASRAAEAASKSGKSADVDFGPYMAALQKKIKRHWFPPRHQKETKHVVAVFKINRNGEVSDARITNSAGKASDDAALTALRNAAPFDKLPRNSPETVDIQFTFDYNVFKNGKKEVATKDGATNKSEDPAGSNNREEKVSGQRDSEPKVSESGEDNAGSSRPTEISEAARQINEAVRPEVDGSAAGSQIRAAIGASGTSSPSTDLGDILKWAIPGVISFLALGGIVMFVMARQRD